MPPTPGRPPHEVAAETPEPLLVIALLRNLADLVAGEAVLGVAGDDGGVVVASSWPPRPPGQPLGPDPLAAGMAAAEPVPGGATVFIGGRREVRPAHREALQETASWLGLALRLGRAHADRNHAGHRAATLEVALRETRERLAAARDLERRRLTDTVTGLAAREFADVRSRVDDLRDAVVTGSPVGPATAALRDALDDLLDTFRTIVRGVHPAMLPDSGPRAALEELAAFLPRRVRFSGDLGRRAGWEVESGLYHAAAAVLTLLAGWDTDTTLAVDLSDDGDVLEVVLTDPVPNRTAAALTVSLATDAERLTVLGGLLECGVRPGGVVAVAVRLPRRTAVRPDPVRAAPTLRDLVHDLIEQGWQMSTEADRPQWSAIARHLDPPARLAVAGRTDTDAVVGALLGVAVARVDRPTAYVHTGAGLAAPTLPVVELPVPMLHSLTVIDLPGPVEAWLRGGPDLMSSVDAVLLLDPPDPAVRTGLADAGVRVITAARLRPALALVAATLRDEERRALRSPAPDPSALRRLPPADLARAIAVARAMPGPDRVAAALADEAGLAELRATVGATLLARPDDVAARRALWLVAEVLRGLPGDHPMRWSVEWVRTHGHEIAELDLLHAVTDGTVSLGEARSEALGLLGANGVDPRVRLGLLGDVPDDRVRAAALAGADRWRAVAGNPAATTRIRVAGEVLARTCDGLARLPGYPPTYPATRVPWPGTE